MVQELALVTAQLTMKPARDSCLGCGAILKLMRIKDLLHTRVIENPTCLWSTWDASDAGVAPQPDPPIKIQERTCRRLFTFRRNTVSLAKSIW